MSMTEISLLGEVNRSNWIRLRTMILLRWIAIIGQLSALTVARNLYDLELELGLCYLAVGVSVIGNMVAIFVFPENKRLTESENLAMVMFDLLQLGFLLYLTGGLHNPFSLLVLGPVTVSAAVLKLRSTVLLVATAFAMVSALVFFHLPLHTTEGEVLRLPDMFVFGQWAAISIALIFISVYARRITREMHAMGDALTATQMALSRAQQLNDLGGVIAAAAHELGTPLATIKLTSSELIEDLADRPEQQDDARLIREQADRCRDILRSMGRAGKDDLHMRQAPLVAVIREAAEPHQDRGKDIVIQEIPDPGGHAQQPQILRRPEIIHGLRNLIQNAVDFARATIWIEAGWSDGTISIRILDDGPGFPPHLIGRMGEPFVRKRRSEADRLSRPAYEGMGLGLFIAKTLLERTGAELSFANGTDPFLLPATQGERRGAIVEVIWPRARIVPETGNHSAGIGENRPIEV
ncbi:sensor histidine kinase RegB [Puniceibacterium sp. IMCC21224]|uniref:sensor histidine kinase RegB n=1 Tax=Puniceibacterium sp. IMCC21224 TaxID=1618204 RepID=UPI00064DDA2D|nr:ActS/PrrB/RegB family redox-sensitive histidine kinase [Puniceibacterium sp. IMCC21224]KMK65287.1 signal transduction histidine kinase [Puniceibacterium sp. IMCC21224]